MSASNSDLHCIPVDQTAASKWLRTAELYNKKLRSIENTSQIKLHHIEPKWIRYLEEEQHSLELKRKHTEKKVAENLNRIRRLTTNTCQMLEEGIEEQTVVEVLNRALSNVQTEITEFRKGQQMEMNALQKEEALLERDLDAMVQWINSAEWKTHTYNQRDSATPLKSLPSHGEDSGVLLEVLEYDDWLEKHGPTGGWEVEDHKEFLRLLYICKGDYSLTTQLCCKELLGISKEEIIAHGRWHSVFCDLSDKKRTAIASWKAEKEKRKCAQNIDHVLEEEAELRERTRQAKEEEKLMRKIKSEVQHQLIDLWKKQKAEEELQRNKAQQIEVIKQMEKEQAQKLAQNQKRTLVLQYQKSRKEANRKAILEAEEQRKHKTLQSSLDPESKDRIAQKSKQLMERKTQKAKQKQKVLLEKERRVTKMKKSVQVSVARDPRRLTEATVASKHRNSALTDPDLTPKHQHHQSNFIRHVQHKGTPNWIKHTTGTLVI